MAGRHTMRAAYVRRRGAVYVVDAKGAERPISMAQAKAQLEAHRAGAKNLSLGQAAADVSAELARQLEEKITAAEEYTARLAELRQKPTTDEIRQARGAAR